MVYILWIIAIVSLYIITQDVFGNNATNLYQNDLGLSDLEIDCIYNCKHRTNVQEIVCMRVKGPWTLLVEHKFNWYLIENSFGSGRTSITGIRQSPSLPSFILLLKENTLSERTTYFFKVTINNSHKFAKHKIMTTSMTINSCSVNPDRGEAGVTIFEISCSREDNSRLLEFYDKKEIDEQGFSGRMFSSQEAGNGKHFKLTRGRLEIVSFDEVGMKKTIELNVHLSKRSLNSVDIESQLADLEKHSAAQDVGETLQTASVLADLLAHQINNHDRYAVSIMEKLIQFLSTLYIKRHSDAKQCLSTLHIALSAARGSLSLDSAWYSARILHTLMEALAVGLMNGQLYTFFILYQICTHILDCIYVIINTKETQYNNPVFYTKVREITKFVLKISFLLRSVLSYRHFPGQEHKLIEARLGKLSIWIKVDIPSDLSSFTQQEHRKNKFPVIIPDELAEDVKNMNCYLALSFLSFEQNPTWSKISNTKNTMDASVCFKQSSGPACEFPSFLANGFQVTFEVTDLSSSGKFTNLTLRGLEYSWLNEELTIYKIDPMPSADVEAFFKLYSPDTELIVIAVEDRQPIHTDLVEKEYKITKENLVLKVATSDSLKRHFYFLGIQPSDKVAEGRTIIVGIKVYSKTCLMWHGHWEEGGCYHITNKLSNDLICECNKNSLIGGCIKEEILSSATVTSFPLLPTTITNGKLKIISLLFLIGSFLILALVCKRVDRHDMTRRFVNILPDNIPGERFGYLVHVFTGARIGAGTDAAVGIRIVGSKNDGRRHILKGKRHVMKGIGEDWFLIFERESVGTIKYVNLWHDNTGGKPAWFCDSITIYDLHHKNCYVFVVNGWISLSSKRYPQVDLTPTPYANVVSPPRVFLEYLTSGFLLSHVWLDVVARHPRDPVSRLDRLAIISCFLIVSMAFSLKVIILTDKDVRTDDYSFSLTWPMVEIGIYSCIVSGVIACLLMHLFRRVYTIIFYIEHHRNTTTKNVISTRFSVHEDYLTSPSALALNKKRTFIHYGRKPHKERHNPLWRIIHFGRRPHKQHHQRLDHQVRKEKRTFAEKINLNLMPKPLVPVQLEGDEPNVVINRYWLLLSWITVAVIFLISFMNSLFFLMLPPTKTLKWLTIVGLSIFFHAIIILPLKITMVSAILAVGFKRIIYKDIYTFDPKDGRQTDLYGNRRYLTKLIYMRTLPMYQHLHDVFQQEHKHKLHRMTMWHKIYEIFVEIMVLVCIGMLLQSQIRYHSDEHLKTAIKGLKRELNTTDLRDFQYGLEPYLFKSFWYNWQILSQASELSFLRKDWLGDYNNRIIGKVQLRQFRVKPGIERIFNVSCAEPFSQRTMDTTSYLPFWFYLTRIKIVHSSIEDDLDRWHFYWPNNDSNFQYTGSTGQTYPSGGYIWDLEASGDDMDAALDDLWNERWIGQCTRAVLAHVKVFNVNTRIFSEIVLLAEQTIAGQMLPLTVVQSLELDVRFDKWLIIFIFFTFMLLVRIFMLTNRVGVIGLFKNWRHPYAILTTVNAVAVLYYLCLHLLTAPQYVTDYLIQAEESKFFDFYKIAHFSFTSKDLLYVMYILYLFHLFSLFRFGKTLFTIFYTIKRSILHVIWVFLIFILIHLLLFKPVSFLLTCFEVSYSSTNIYKFNYSSFATTKSKKSLKLFSFMMGFANVFITILLVPIFIQQYKATRFEMATQYNIGNYFTFLYEEITTVLRTPQTHGSLSGLVQTKAVKHEGRKHIPRF